MLGFTHCPGGLPLAARHNPTELIPDLVRLKPPLPQAAPKAGLLGHNRTLGNCWGLDMAGINFYVEHYMRDSDGVIKSMERRRQRPIPAD